MNSPCDSISPGSRLFVALLPDQAVRAALAQHVTQWRWNPGAARYGPADWHVTLHFLGVVAEDRMDDLLTSLRLPCPAFELHFGQAELWQHGLAVLCPLLLPDALQQLYAGLGESLRALGLRTDARAYRPHVTLARHAGRSDAPLQPPSFVWPVSGYALMGSTGDPAQRYRVIQRYGAAA